MSTVVGLKMRDDIWIGCDSRASNDEGECRPIIAKKLFRNGDYLVGFIGSVRSGQVTRPEQFKAPKDINDWPDALIEQHGKKGCLITSSGSTSIIECNYIIGDTKTNKLYEILSDLQLNEVEKMTAIGSGSPYAYGSLFSTQELNIKDGAKRVEYALKAAQFLDTATGGKKPATLST